MINVSWPWVKKEVLRTERIDERNKDERSKMIRLAMEECMHRARSLIAAKYVFTEKKVTALKNDLIEIEGGIKFYTKKTTAYIKGATHIALFLVTIGPGLEDEASALTSGKDPLKGYLLDRVGSFAVESLADNLEKKLRKDYSLKKNSVSSRFSPGYCDWPIDDQFKMARAIDFSKAGVVLTEGCMMVPKKSISAIAAIAGKGVFKKLVSSCDVCLIKDCNYRRVY